MLAHFSYLLHEVVIEPIKIAEEIIYLHCSINAGGYSPHPPFNNATYPLGRNHPYIALSMRGDTPAPPIHQRHPSPRNHPYSMDQAVRDSA